MRILVVEDEPDLVEVLREGLEEAGYAVDVAYDGVEGEAKALAGGYDAFIVDWMMPKQDGPTMVRRLREAGIAQPVLMLTAFIEVERRVEGLDAGADDYLTKPFAFTELFARLRALSRRAPKPDADSLLLEVGPLRIDLRRREATLHRVPLDLRPKEFALLELLARRRDEVVSRSVIAEQVWGTVYGVTDDVINMTVSNLRNKMEEVRSPEAAQEARVVTRRGMGYSLDVKGPAPER